MLMNSLRNISDSIRNKILILLTSISIGFTGFYIDYFIGKYKIPFLFVGGLWIILALVIIPPKKPSSKKKAFSFFNKAVISLTAGALSAAILFFVSCVSVLFFLYLFITASSPAGIHSIVFFALYLILLAATSAFSTYACIKQVGDNIFGILHPASLWGWLFFIYMGLGAAPGLIDPSNLYLMESSINAYFVAGVVAILAMAAFGIGIITKSYHKQRINKSLASLEMKWPPHVWWILLAIYGAIWYGRLRFIASGGLIYYGFGQGPGVEALGVDQAVKLFSNYTLPILLGLYLFVKKWKIKRIIVMLMFSDGLYLFILNNRRTLILTAISCVFLYALVKHSLPTLKTIIGVILLLVLTNSLLVAMRIERRNILSEVSLVSEYITHLIPKAGESLLSSSGVSKVWRKEQKKYSHRLNGLMPLAAIMQKQDITDISFMYGSTFDFYLIAWIPRFIWHGKPIGDPPWGAIRRHFKLPHKAILVLMVLELYANFGIIGVVAGMFLYGRFLSWLYHRMVLKPTPYQALYMIAFAGFLFAILSVECGLPPVLYSGRVVFILLILGWILKLKGRAILLTSYLPHPPTRYVVNI